MQCADCNQFYGISKYKKIKHLCVFASTAPMAGNPDAVLKTQPDSPRQAPLQPGIGGDMYACRLLMQNIPTFLQSI